MAVRSKFAAFAVIAAAVVSIASLWQQDRRPNRPPLVAATYHDVPPLLRSLRPIYPYSIIPGGVFSKDELRQRLADDIVARKHYGNFDVDHVRLVRLTGDQWRYVSYRVRNEVFWTRKQLRIPGGELLLTDGVHLARSRCGNLLSAVPNSAVSDQEPTTELNLHPVDSVSISDPVFKLLPAPDLQVAPSEPLPELASLFALPRSLSSPAPSGQAETNQADGKGEPPSNPYFATVAVASRGLVGTHSTVGPNLPGQPIQPDSPVPSQPLPPLYVPVPEPGFILPIGIALLWLILRSIQFRMPLQQKIQC